MPTHTLQEELRKRREKVAKSPAARNAGLIVPREMLPEARPGDRLELRVMGEVTGVAEDAFDVRVMDVAVVGAEGATAEAEQISPGDMLPPDIRPQDVIMPV